MKRLHFISGIIIILFVGLHLFNHLTGMAGAERHIQVMEQLRQVYRNVFAETILLAAVLLQIVSGIGLFRSERKQAVTAFEKLQLWTGLYLAFFLVIHVGAVMAGRSILHLDTNFYFGVAGINTFPLNVVFIPYYALAVLSFFGHIAAVHRLKMKGPLLGIPPQTQAVILLLTGLSVTILIFYSLTDRFTGVEIPPGYNILIGK